MVETDYSIGHKTFHTITLASKILFQNLLKEIILLRSLELVITKDPIDRLNFILTGIL